MGKKVGKSLQELVKKAGDEGRKVRKIKTVKA